MGGSSPPIFVVAQCPAERSGLPICWSERLSSVGHVFGWCAVLSSQTHAWGVEQDAACVLSCFGISVMIIGLMIIGHFNFIRGTFEAPKKITVLHNKFKKRASRCRFSCFLQSLFWLLLEGVLRAMHSAYIAVLCLSVQRRVGSPPKKSPQKIRTEYLFRWTTTPRRPPLLPTKREPLEEISIEEWVAQ